jgi:hypothetical protein
MLCGLVEVYMHFRGMYSLILSFQE